ncbi:MAG TPA: caspase family protein [Anaeromyxobacteraceae bacterium]
MRRFLVLLAAIASLPAAVSASPASARFAVVVGSDAGAPGRPRLWFAEKDAEGFARTLRELGDFAQDRVALLRGAQAGAVREALAAAEANVRLAQAAGERTLLVFYYSGHAAAGGLELGPEKLPFGELRALLGGSSADARVAIVDACEAGLLTQVKGAAAAPAIDFALPTDEDVKGTAYIASTAVGEQAQESAAIGGSFFTHHLEVALHGAGDSDGDGLVTLAEAFRYTSSMTVAGTSITEAGAQHPTYEFHMSGRGDVVLADLRRADAKLRLPADVGSSYVLRGPGGVMAEVVGASAPIALGLAAGRYAVERRSPYGRASGAVTLEKGDDRDLPLLTPTRYELARSKGGPKPGLLYTGVGVSWVALPGFGAAPSVGLGLREEVGPVGLRARLEYAFRHVQDQALRYDYALTSGSLAALYPVNANKILLEVGPSLGYGYATQRLADRQTFSSGVLNGGAAFVLTVPLGPVRAGLDGALGVQRFKLDGASTVRPAASAALLVLYGF